MKVGILSTLCAVLLFFFLLSTCSVSPKTSAVEEGNEEDRIQRVNDLFIEGDDPHETEFRTNDPAFWSPLGYTLWCLKNDLQNPFSERSVTCSKISGDDIAGYGIIFCHYNDPDPEIGESMLAVMLNTLGEYIVGEIVDDSFSLICPWTYSPFLSQGYNQTNRLHLASNGEEFELYLNHHLVCTFSDEEAPLHSGGDNGYIVVISPQDKFPEETVYVRFME